ncbi:hypothetical protein, partial [Patulibacter defluvii]|uniref:hypothetical protein n=1 Tax=Patulibacter defluvii TaxID=3095358 RepID=UPI002A756A2F
MSDIDDLPNDAAATAATEPATDDGWDPDPWDEQEHEPLPVRPRRPSLLRPLPLALGGMVLVAGGFIAGVQVQKGQTDGAAAGAPAGLRAALAGRGGLAGGGGLTGGGGLAGGGGGPGAAA